MLSSQAPAILLVLVIAVVLFGIGTVLLSRSRAGKRESAAREPERKVAAKQDSEPTSQPASEVVAEPFTESAAAPRDMRSGASRVRSLLSGAFSGIRSNGITDAVWDDLEEALLRADVGIRVATALLAPLKDQVRNKSITSPEQLEHALRGAMTSQLSPSDRSLRIDETNKPSVWLFVGVNGVGKTTTIGKISHEYMSRGVKVLLAAGDTFRAAAAEQLQTWAERSGAEFVRGSEGGDPASVIFDGVQAAGARNIDLVLADTAGRLQTKSNLMDELSKVRRIADRGPGAVTEVLLVIDATTGQNGLSQAREFAQATQVTGVVLTKLDGSAKGGIVFAIETELGIPVKLVGVGETIVDLLPFVAEDYVDALFD